MTILMAAVLLLLAVTLAMLAVAALAAHVCWRRLRFRRGSRELQADWWQKFEQDLQEYTSARAAEARRAEHHV
jgi:hypothetical protein